MLREYQLLMLVKKVPAMQQIEDEFPIDFRAPPYPNLVAPTATSSNSPSASARFEALEFLVPFETLKLTGSAYEVLSWES